MEYTIVSGTQMNVSRIALGTWAIGGWMWGAVTRPNRFGPFTPRSIREST
jgi:aryl-alcohol dehydrogenase-like predicted oxidoreductase